MRALGHNNPHGEVDPRAQSGSTTSGQPGDNDDKEIPPGKKPTHGLRATG